MKLPNADAVEIELRKYRAICSPRSIRLSVDETQFGRKYTVVEQLKGPIANGLDPDDMDQGARKAVHDIPQHGLRAGDVGAIVGVYGDEAFEVEFVRPSGDTQALIALKATDLRPVTKTDVLSVRAP